MNLSMTEVYDSTINNVKKYIRAKDLAANYKRSDFDLDDFTQGFYLYLFENKKRKKIKTNDRLIDRFDQSRVNSSDQNKALFNFIVNHLRNYYKLSMQEDLKHNDCIAAVTNSLNEEHTSYHNGEIIYNNTQEERENFCNDFRKTLQKKFIRGLNKLERGAYKFFIEDNLAPKEVALKLNVTRRTAQNLRNSINFKAQQIMSEY